MSGLVVGWAMRQRTGSPAAKLVLAKLADNSNEQGLCWPSIELLVEHTELGQSTVYKHLALLEELQLIRPVDHIIAHGVVLKAFQLNIANASEKIPPRGKQKQVKNAIPPGGKTSPPAGISVPPAGMHIEEPSSEPSVNRHSLAPAVAVESENVASLGKGEPERWPELRKAIADTWPNGFPADNEIACRTEFERQTRTRAADLIIACARAHGAVLTDRQRQRGQKAGAMLVKRPNNWLKEGDWQGYIPQVHAAEEQDAEIATALGRLRRAVGDGLFGVLRTVMTDPELAKLDGLTLEEPSRILHPRPFQRVLLERHIGAIERQLGEPPVFTLVAERKTS